MSDIDKSNKFSGKKKTFKPIEDLKNFYIVIIPEQDPEGLIVLNRMIRKLRSWYFCSQSFNKEDPMNKKVIEIINYAREIALAEAWSDCGFEGGFKLEKPKSCNENTARRYMSNRLVIVLDNFNIEEMTCQIHNNLLCRNIKDDPRTWKRVPWGKKINKPYHNKKHNYNKDVHSSTLGDIMPNNIVGKQANEK